jgi:cell division protease FtsH
MSERLGPMSFRIGEDHVFLGKEIQEPRDFSEGTAQIIDEEVQKLLLDADKRAFDLLRDNRVELDRIVDALLEREELDRKEIEELLNPEHRTEGPLEESASPPMILAPTPGVG